MGIDSEKLSRRLRQPGHDRTFEFSEKSFVKAARLILEPEFIVIPNPKDLLNIFPREGARGLGISPEASITSPRTTRTFFIEVKKQGRGGNAEERAAKHHTKQFYKTLHDIYGYNYHPYVTIFCESLATESRYTSKFPYLYERNQYFLWTDYSVTLLRDFLIERCAEWLENG